MSRSVHSSVIESKCEVIETDRCRPRQKSDELVCRVRSGDKNVDQLPEPHVSLRQYRVRSILQNDADTQDVVQDAMLCAFTKLHQLRAASKMAAKLTNIVLAIALLGVCALAQDAGQSKTVDNVPDNSQGFEALLFVVPDGVNPNGPSSTEAGRQVDSADMTDIRPQHRLQTNTLPRALDNKQMATSGPSPYYWKSKPVGDTAQLLTLFCSGCNVSTGNEGDVPLVSVLRDTLGDQANENDRVTYVWLLTYAHRSLGQRFLSAIPFFYWRVGQGSGSVSAHDTKPLMDLSAPEHPMMARIGQDLVQSTAFDPTTTAVRASTQGYRSKERDEERLHLEEAINYLRQAPVSNDLTALTQAQLDTVIGRLKLRKTMLGGLAGEKEASLAGKRSAFEQERIRSRNLELLRQWAEKTGLILEPLNLAGSEGHYAILWFPQEESAEPGGTSMQSIWRLLGIRNPWNDEHLKNWKGPVYERVFDENRPLKVIPLAVYSLNYPKLPLIMVDFRNNLRGRQREVRPRFVSELTGMIGLSHFTNWYFYIGVDLYRFVTGRHGKAVDAASRLDCFSDFRMQLALDNSIDQVLKQDMENRVGSLAVNQLGAAPEREIHAAIDRYKLLEAEAEDGRLMSRVDQERRFELSSFGESEKAKLARSMLQAATLGLYNQRASRANLSVLDCYRRIAYQLNFLKSIVQPGTPPEVAYDSQQIKSSVRELSSLVATISSASVRSQAEATLKRLKNFSKDAELQAECATALAMIRQTDARRNVTPARVAALSRGRQDSSPNPE